MKRSPFLFLVALTTLAIPSLMAELPVPTTARVTKSWTFPYYRVDEVHGRLLQSISEGTSALPLGNGIIKVTDLKSRILRSGDQKQVQITLLTPECLFDTGTMEAYSSNRIQIFSPTTNVFMQGRGFYCSHTNSLIIVSNNVETSVRRDVTNQTATATGNATTSLITEETYRVFSDRLELQYESNLVVYSGHVRFIQDQIELNCDRLATRFVTNRFTTNQFTTNSIEEVTADGHVVITAPDYGHATGNHAVYNMTDGNAVIELSGNAAWADNERDGRADRFIYNRSRNQLVADGNALLRFPNTSLNQTNLTGTAQTPRDTNRLTELYARRVTLQLPPTNGPIQGMLAEGNVLITNRFEQSRATAEKASYTRATETFVLTGNPICQMEKGEIRGNSIALCRSNLNQTFQSRGNSFLKLRMAGGGIDSHFGSATNTPANTNRYLQIVARDFDYSDKLATFSDTVHAEFQQAQTTLAALDCDKLNVTFAQSNLNSVIAKGNVRGSQPATSNSPSRVILCDSITVNNWPNSNWAKDANATGNVTLIQYGPTNMITRFAAESVNATFATASNRVLNAVAQSNVWGERYLVGSSNIDSIINGERAVYESATTNSGTLTLMGHPWAIFSSGYTNQTAHTNRLGINVPKRVIINKATSMTWDVLSGSNRMSGPVVATAWTNDDEAIWKMFSKPTFRQDSKSPLKP